MTTTISLHDAEQDLAALLKRARAGEDIVIADGTGPAVKLAPMPAVKPVAPVTPSYRGFGSLKGKISASDQALFGPLPEDELKRWYGEE